MIWLRRPLLICGILSSLLYAAMNIFVPRLYEGYSSSAQTVSELSAIGAPTRAIWILFGIGYTFLITAFGIGIWQSAEGNRPLRIVGDLILAYGLVGFLWSFAPMHQREVLASHQETLTDTMHIVFAMVIVLLMMTAIGFGAVTFGKRFRLYSIVTILILLVFGGLTTFDAPKVNANLPTPWVGVWERINIGVFLFWIIVLSIMLLRMEMSNQSLYQQKQMNRNRG